VVALVVVPCLGLAVTAQEPDRTVARAIRAAMQGLDLSDLGEALRSGGQDFRAEETTRQTVNLPIGSTGTVSIENLSGDITITAASRSDVAVEIIKRSRGRTPDDAARGLDEVTVEIDQRGTRATIETDYPSLDDSPYSVSVTFEISAPPGTAFSVETVAGDVSADGIAGELALSTTAGDVTIRDASNVDEAHTVAGSVRLTNVVADGTLEAESVSGNVTAEGVAASRLSLNSVTGNVSARDSTVDRAELTTMTGSVEYEGRLASGGRYELQSQSGTVTFTSTGGAGFELRASTFGGSIRPERSLGLEAPRPPRRELRGTVGDGGATVVLTTFSGDVVISG
jgi:DUF4097 and DUF4098 domain-containing protein YvlB